MTNNRPPTSETEQQTNEEPLVSICIGVYNQEHYIRECLDSVFAQTYRHLEVIVADNASTDGTLAAVASYPVVRLLRRDVNSNMCSTTRNMACREATGEYIAFLDSDDVWHPDKIARQVDFLQRHPEMPLCHTYCYLIDENSATYGLRHEGKLASSGDYFDALLEHCWVTISSVMIRRSLYVELGPFLETMPYGRSGEDWEFFLRVARKYPFGFIDEPLTKYRKSQHGMTASDWQSQPHAARFLEELWRRQDLWADRVTSLQMKHHIAKLLYENAEHWRYAGYPDRSLYFAWRGLRYRPGWWKLYEAAAKAGVRRIGGRGANDEIPKSEKSPRSEDRMNRCS
jgi:glycosyltransferase involved in cell wall biosynthesis